MRSWHVRAAVRAVGQSRAPEAGGARGRSCSGIFEFPSGSFGDSCSDSSRIEVPAIFFSEFHDDRCILEVLVPATEVDCEMNDA